MVRRMDKTRPTGPAPTIRTGSLAAASKLFVIESSLLLPKYLALQLFLLALFITPTNAILNKLELKRTFSFWRIQIMGGFRRRSCGAGDGVWWSQLFKIFPLIYK